jgi:hypothetical protein
MLYEERYVRNFTYCRSFEYKIIIIHFSNRFALSLWKTGQILVGRRIVCWDLSLSSHTGRKCSGVGFEAYTVWAATFFYVTFIKSTDPSLVPNENNLRVLRRKSCHLHVLNRWLLGLPRCRHCILIHPYDSIISSIIMYSSIPHDCIETDRERNLHTCVFRNRT